MKKLLLTLIAAIALVSVTASETNTLKSLPAPLAAEQAVEGKSEAGGYEFTLGGSGETIEGESSYGVDFSIATNPLEAAPNVWFGLVQGLYWEPKISGSTDVNVNYSQHLFGDLYVNGGWSAGIVYGRVQDEEGVNSTEHFWRTGPEVTFQYYLSDDAFIYAGTNYDIVSEGSNGFRYSWGLGFAF
jgi:hypothetical protein